MEMETDLIFDRLWREYAQLNPSAKKIKALFTAEGEEVLNDHIAFRTLNDKRINIDILASVFLKNGYEPKGEYHFRQKHLFARHFEHKSEASAPKVFISELILENFSPFLQKTMHDWLDKISSEIVASGEIIFAGNARLIPSSEVYTQLRKESEYAAWLYVYGFRANHFTVSVDSLKKFNTIQKINDYLKDQGFTLNSIGGEIKGTPQDLLEQSSTMADLVLIGFHEGTLKIPACYYEFAKRYPDATGKVYSGFIEKSADKIFESTDFYKKNPD
jgi:hypothetical protein